MIPGQHSVSAECTRSRTRQRGRRLACSLSAPRGHDPQLHAPTTHGLKRCQRPCDAGPKTPLAWPAPFPHLAVPSGRAESPLQKEEGSMPLCASFWVVRCAPRGPRLSKRLPGGEMQPAFPVQNIYRISFSDMEMPGGLEAGTRAIRVLVSAPKDHRPWGGQPPRYGMTAKLLPLC